MSSSYFSALGRKFISLNSPFDHWVRITVNAALLAIFVFAELPAQTANAAAFAGENSANLNGIPANCDVGDGCALLQALSLTNAASQLRTDARSAAHLVVPHDASAYRLQRRPEMDLRDNGDTLDILDGDMTPNIADGTDMGAALVGGAGVTSTFRIENNGTRILILRAPIAIGGANPGDFAVIAGPSMRVAPSSFTNFTVRCIPSAVGTRTADLSIRNNDSDENPYDFRVQCTGINHPTIAKAFTPATVGVNNNSTLTFTIANPNAGVSLNGLNFTDTLPAGMVVATPPNQGGTCPTPTFSPALVGGGTQINLTNSGTLAASSSCTITVDVVASPDGSYTNVTGVIGSAQTGSSTIFAVDTVIVRSFPTIDKIFAPAAIAPAGVSTLTFTISNPNTATYTLSGLNFTDALPAGVVIATPPNQGGTCPMQTFAPPLAGGGTAINLISAGVLGLSSACTVTVNVTSATLGNYVNTTGVVGSSETGASSDTATDTLIIGLPPVVVSAIPTGNVTPGPTQLVITFNQDVNDAGGGVNVNDVTNPNNYMLFQTGPDGTYETLDCASGVSGADVQVTPLPGPVAYNAGTFTATVTVNGGTPLPPGDYRVHVCGTTSIENILGIPLGGGVDYNFDFTILGALPDTGFVPGIMTAIPAQPAEKVYTKYGGLWLEIPRLGVEMQIVGVPVVEGEWDVSWLGNNVGYLDGTAFPTWPGNTGITGHVFDANNHPGPFAHLKELQYGNVVLIHAWGQIYTYVVRSNYLASPANMYPLHQEAYDWVTLLTCERYSERSETYRFRRVVRAVLVEVAPEIHR
ncbi:MAG: choice-of-anchor D domain-containing protein [Anaerolineales bacterium]|nr:choice-of-anchor D domain-containing protein [Anaerolineales bacterium]